MSDARQHAITLILGRFGSLRDLEPPLPSIIWVTTLRACELGSALDDSSQLTSNFLRGGTALADSQNAVRKLKFLDEMISQYRTNGDKNNRIYIMAVLNDMLKYGITDAPNMSVIARMFARARAKVDPEYKSKVPAELLA